MHYCHPCLLLACVSSSTVAASCPTSGPGGPTSCSDLGHTSLDAATAAKTIALDNQGAVPLTLLDVVPVGPQAAAFVIDPASKPAANAEVRPGLSAVSVAVACKPTSYPSTPPAAGSSVALTAQLRFLFAGRRAFDVPVACHLDGPANGGGGAPGPVPPQPSEWLQLGEGHTSVRRMVGC